LADPLYFAKDRERRLMVVEIVELFPNRLGEPEWFITDKIPLHYQTGEGQVSVG
jgi:hypothetical protein